MKKINSITLNKTLVRKVTYTVFGLMFLFSGMHTSYAQIKAGTPSITSIDGNIITAQASSKEVFVTFNSDVDMALAKAFANESPVLSFAGENSLHRPMNGILFSYTGPATKLEDELKSLRNNPQVSSAYPGYNFNGEVMYIHSDMLIKPHPGMTSITLRNQLAARGLNIKAVFDMGVGDDIWLVEVPVNQDIWSISQEFQAYFNVDYAMPDLIATSMHDLTPNDPSFGSQWFLDQANDADIDAPEAWDITTGNASVVVAVIDGNGYDLSHPDLSGNVVSPYDAVNNDNNPSPENSDANHGTPCAGLVAASTNNSLGVASVGFNIRVKPVVIGYNAVGNSFTTTAAIVVAAANSVVSTAGVVAVSNSYGGGVSFWTSASVSGAFNNMKNNCRGGLGAVILASSGNSGSGTSIGYPAASSNTLAVGSSNQSDNRTPSSQYGTFGAGLDLVAPGNQTFTIDRSGSAGYNSSAGVAGNYTNFSGTSAACPVAAGVVGLIASRNPGLTEAQLEAILCQSCDKVNPGTYSYGAQAGKPHGTWDNEMGYGRVNAFSAVTAACPAYAGTITSSSPSLVCFDDQGIDIFSVTTNGDFSWAGAPEEGVIYLLYNQDPTGLDPATDNPLVSVPAFIDIIGSASAGCFGSGTTGQFENTLGGNQQYWVVPVALFDECPVGFFQDPSDPTDCQDAGYNRAISFIALDEITVDTDVSCGAAQGTFDVTFSNFDGGIPGYNNGQSYTVSGDGPGGSVAHNGQYVVAGVAGSTTVTITVADGNGCSVSFNYTTPPSYTPAILGLAADYCENDPAVIITGTPDPTSPAINTAAFAGSGITEGTPNDGIATFDPAAAGLGPHIISYTVTDTLGCTYVETETVTVRPVPFASDTTYYVCDGDVLAFDLQGHVNATGNGVNSNFEWSSSAVAGVNGNSTTSQFGDFITDSLANTTIVNQTVEYTVIPTSDPYGCVGPPFKVTVIVRPSPKTQVLPASSCPGTMVDIARLVRDYSFLALTFDFYDGDPYGGGTLIGRARASQGQAHMANRVYVAPTVTTTYWVVATTIFGCEQILSFPVTVNNCNAVVAPIAILEGAYDATTGLQRTSLQQQSLVPATEPYTGLGYAFQGGGGETMNVPLALQSKIVDWVVLELRDPASINHIVYSRAALLLDDGRIVDVDGSSNPAVTASPNGSYYVVLIHRNHLAIMTDQPVPMGSTVDFSSPLTAVHGGSANARAVVNGKALLYSGDANGDGQVQNTDDVLIWMPQAGTSGYQGADYNLDGQVQNTDRILIWNRNVGRGTAVPK